MGPRVRESRDPGIRGRSPGHTSTDQAVEIRSRRRAGPETARAAGAHGARMTGGGFGGCIIALVPEGASDRVGQAVATAFAEAGHGAPAWFVGVPSAGARRLS